MKNQKTTLIFGMFIALMVLMSSQLVGAAQPDGNPPTGDVDPNFGNVTVQDTFDSQGVITNSNGDIQIEGALRGTEDSQGNSGVLELKGADKIILDAEDIDFSLDNTNGQFLLDDPYENTINSQYPPIFKVGRLFEIKGGLGLNSYIGVSMPLENKESFNNGKVVIKDPDGAEVRSKLYVGGELTVSGKVGNQYVITNNINVPSNQYNFTHRSSCFEPDDIVLNCGYEQKAQDTDVEDIYSYIRFFNLSYYNSCFYEFRNPTNTSDAMETKVTCLDLDTTSQVGPRN